VATQLAELVVGEPARDTGSDGLLPRGGCDNVVRAVRGLHTWTVRVQTQTGSVRPLGGASCAAMTSTESAQCCDTHGMTRQLGVEEELLLVDPDSGAALPVIGRLLPRGAFEAELMREQIEVQTRPCTTLRQLRELLATNRQLASEAATAEGAAIAALGTAPLPTYPSTVTSKRFLLMREAYGLTAREQLTCGCHVHVEVESREEGVAALDRLRPWNSVLLALCANSPFWQGEDTGYASYRGRVWGRWPSSGPTGLFGSAKAYDETVDVLVGTGVLLDKKMIYFDARLSEANPTVEIRAADVCRTVDGAVLLAALSRALVETAIEEWRQGHPPHPARTELLRVASWRAARSGLAEDLVDVYGSAKPRPAAEVVASLLDYVRPVLERQGEWDEVIRLTADALDGGTGAERQRRVYQESQDLADVVKDAVRATLAR
jgi:carboxylate-amine ligase